MLAWPLFEVGDVVASYTILAHLKTGGMASLYLARKRGVAGFNRLVAVKVIHPRHSDDADLIDMFVDEALVTARIDHPNVVHVEELGEKDDAYFMVMEYVHGCSLAQLMRVLGRNKRRLSPLVAVAICARVAEGLHAAHETTDDAGNLLGIVHRDVSPQNILLSHKGHVKLIDFGIAKARMRRQESNVGSLKGKVRYMAPEQATTGVVDRRTDVYALGIVLWELLTMRRLFSGRNEFEILMQVRRPKIVPPSRYATEIGPDLDSVVLRALSVDPDERFANAKEMRRQLARALPRSMGIDSAHIADLLVSLLGDELDRVRHELPDDISRVLRAEQARVVGLEEAERMVSSEAHVDSVAPPDPGNAVGVYTLLSGELQFDDDTPAPAAPATDPERSPTTSPVLRSDAPPAASARTTSDRPADTSESTLDASAEREAPDPTERAERPPEVMQPKLPPPPPGLKANAAVGRAIPATTSGPQPRMATFPELAISAAVTTRLASAAGLPAAGGPEAEDDNSPTEVSGRKPVVHAEKAEQILAATKRSSAPPAPPPSGAVRAAPSPMLVVAYGVALALSIIFGIAAALYAPSCEGGLGWSERSTSGERRAVIDHQAAILHDGDPG